MVADELDGDEMRGELWRRPPERAHPAVGHTAPSVDSARGGGEHAPSDENGGEHTAEEGEEGLRQERVLDCVVRQQRTSEANERRETRANTPVARGGSEREGVLDRSGTVRLKA